MIFRQEIDAIATYNCCQTMAKNSLESGILRVCRDLRSDNRVTGKRLDSKEEVLEVLRASIGRQTAIKGRHCQLVEILEDGPEVVLQCIEKRSVIQPDQYGEAHRRVPEIITVPVFDADGDSVNPFLIELGLFETDNR